MRPPLFFIRRWRGYGARIQIGQTRMSVPLQISGIQILCLIIAPAKTKQKLLYFDLDHSACSSRIRLTSPSSG